MKNYTFSSVLAAEFCDYVKLRESQGFSSDGVFVLQWLDKYLITENVIEKTLTPAIVDGFLAAYRPNRSVKTMRNYASICSIFSKYLQTLGITAFVPEVTRVPSSYLPHIFSSEEMNDVFTASDNLELPGIRKTVQLSRIQFPMLLRLLYGCGLRLGEALSLRLSDVDFSCGVIRVLNGKGNKDRLVPKEQTLTDILQRYCRTIISRENVHQFLFPNESYCKPRDKTWAEWHFKRILRRIGIEPSRETCVHCLRHTFAVHSFRKQDLAGIDSYKDTPLLSIYLGHNDLTGTEKYLHMDSENAEDFIDATSKYSNGLFPEVPQ